MGAVIKLLDLKFLNTGWFVSFPGPIQWFLKEGSKKIYKTLLTEIGGILYSSFNNPYKKICETRKLESIHEWHFAVRKMTVENQRQKVESEKTRVYAQKPRLKMPFKNSISGFTVPLLCYPEHNSI